jgi:hypothetical protein
MTHALASAVLHSEGSAGEGPSPREIDKRFICVTHSSTACTCVQCAYDTVAEQPAFVTLSHELYDDDFRVGIATF